MGIVLTELPNTYRPGTKGTIWENPDANLMALNLWLDGDSATEVAGKIGHKFKRKVSRSAVISRMHRLGFARGARYHRLDSRIGLQRKPKRNPPEKSFCIVENPKKIRPPQERVIEKPAPEKSIPFDMLDELKDENGKLYKNCRWVYGSPRAGTHSFCSCPALPGTSWCAGHHVELRQKKKPDEERPAKQLPVRTFAMLEAAE